MKGELFMPTLKVKEKSNTTAVTFRIDGAAKNQAEQILDDIGINMTTYLVSSVKALLREKRVPFAMVASQYLFDQEIVARLIESEQEANNPNTKWMNHDEVFAPLREKYGYDIQD
jgi:addiction module RelB/DinJ family antitoxin